MTDDAAQIPEDAIPVRGEEDLGVGHQRDSTR
jgi:hypothetical protein